MVGSRRAGDVDSQGVGTGDNSAVTRAWPRERPCSPPGEGEPRLRGARGKGSGGAGAAGPAAGSSWSRTPPGRPRRPKPLSTAGESLVGDARGGAGGRAALPGRSLLLGGRRAAKALCTARGKLRAPSVPPRFFPFVCPWAISCRTSTYDLSSTTPVLFSTLLSADST